MTEGAGGLGRLFTRGGGVTARPGLLGAIWDGWRVARGGPTAIAARQQARLAALVAAARAHSSFYAARYHHLPAAVADLHALPPVTKPELMAHFDAWVTDPAVTRARVEAFAADPALVGHRFLKRYTVYLTSGTTGDRALFLHDWPAVTIYDTLVATRGWPGWVRSREVWPLLRQNLRMASVVATGSHFAGVTSWEHLRRRHRSLARRLRTFSVFTPLRELVAALNAYQPAILFGYPTALVLLGQEQAAGRLAIRPVLVLYAGEWLSPTAEAALADAFRCRVRGIYGASEFPYMAFACDHGWLHLNADWVILEPVDADDRPVAPGEPSRGVLLTNLANWVQPIIRYNVGDSITLKPEPCPCGSPFPALHVEGRADEVLTFATPAGATVRVLPMALSALVEAVPGIERFQIIQTGPAHLRVRFDAAPAAVRTAVWEAIRQRLATYLAAQGLPAVSLEPDAEPPARTAGGKYRHVWAERSARSAG